MVEVTLHTQIQQIMDEAIGRIQDLTRKWLISEVSSAFDVTADKPDSASSKGTTAAKKKKRRKPLSPEKKANLMKNLEKAWAAKSAKAKARHAEAKAASKKKKARPSRKPARAK